MFTVAMPLKATVLLLCVQFQTLAKRASPLQLQLAC
jgi:hypothetical protein